MFLAVSFSILNKFGVARVGANTSVLLYPEGSQFGTQTLKLSPSETFGQIHHITVTVQSCSTISTTQITLPVKTRTVETTSNSTVIPFNYNVGSTPLYTVNSGYVTFAVNGKIKGSDVNQPSCLARALFFTDYTSFLRFSHSGLYANVLTEVCLYSKDKQQSTISSNVPLNATGFYFIALSVPQDIVLQINQTVTYRAYQNDANAKKQDCRFTNFQTTCTVGLPDLTLYETKCIFVQSELYFHLLYEVTFTNLNIGLTALSIALLLVISSLIVTGGVLCCFLSAKDDQTKVNPKEDLKPVTPKSLKRFNSVQENTL